MEQFKIAYKKTIEELTSKRHEKHEKPEKYEIQEKQCVDKNQATNKKHIHNN